MEKELWDKEFVEQMAEYGKIEETSAIRLSKLKEDQVYPPERTEP